MMLERSYFVPSEEGSTQPLKVLLIDTTKKSRIVTQHILKANGFQVLVAKSHMEAMRIMNDRCGTIHFVISNIKQGFEAGKQIRKCGYSKPIIYFTEKNIKEQEKLQLFPDSASVYPISTRNNLWVIRKS